MTGLRVVEHYTSVQGEGPRTGQMTQFVRFAGCNMRCPGWPCDTQHAIQPAIWRAPGGSTVYTPHDLSLAALFERDTTGATNVCLTGGEPFVQPAEALERFVQYLSHEGLTIEVFTNGSFIFPRWALFNLGFIMDWKLPGSGEHTTKIEERFQNALALRPHDAIKFVCADDHDFEWAIHAYKELVADDCQALFYAGVAWDKELTTERLVALIKKHRLPWRLNVQTHKFIWAPEAQGV